LSYQWSASPSFDPIIGTDPAISVIPIDSNTFYVRSIGIGGCIAVDSVKIVAATIDVQAEPFDGDICIGETTSLLITNLDITDILNFTWSPNLPNVPNPVVSPTSSTNYQVVVSNQYGCTQVLALQVNVITVGVDATVTGPNDITAGESTTLLATPSGNGVIVSYEWSPAGSLNNANIPDPTASPETDQVYVVTVTTANGCTAVDSVQVRVAPGQCVEPYIFVPNVFTPNNDANNDFFIVRGVNMTELLLVVWDRWGEKLYETTDLGAKGWDGTYKGQESTPDSYAWYVRVRCGNGAFYEKKGDVTLMK
jgi:gliding motility-associated-like protein